MSAFFTVDTGYNGTKTAISFFENPGDAPFRLDFVGGASSVSIDVGDFGSDADPFAGAVYWDNINWEPAGTVEVPVPVSGTSALFALSFAAFAWSKRKKA